MVKKFALFLLVLALVTLAAAANAQVLEAYGLSKGGHIALAMVLISASLWLTEIVPLFITSLFVLIMAITWLAPALSSASQTGSFDTSLFYGAFASDVIFLFLGSFSLSTAFRIYKLDQWLVHRLLGGRTMALPRLMLALMFLTTLLSFWLSNSATAALMLGLVLPVTKQLDPNDPGRKALILAVPFAANIGGLGTPISSPPNAIAMEYMRLQGVEPSFLQWMIIALPGIIALTLVGWGLLLLLFRPRQQTVTFTADNFPLNADWRVFAIVCILFLTVLGWVSAPYHGISNGIVAMLPMVTLFGLGILKHTHLPELSWDVLLLMGGGLCLGLAAKESGLAEWSLGLLPTERLTFYQLMLALSVGGVLISSVMSNTAAASLILPIAVMMSVPNPTLFTLAITFTCTMAIPLPISTPPNAIAFSTGELPVRDMAKAGTLMTVLSVVLTVTLGYAYWLYLENLF